MYKREVCVEIGKVTPSAKEWLLEALKDLTGENVKDLQLLEQAFFLMGYDGVIEFELKGEAAKQKIFNGRKICLEQTLRPNTDPNLTSAVNVEISVFVPGYEDEYIMQYKVLGETYDIRYKSSLSVRIPKVCTTTAVNVENNCKPLALIH